MDKRTGLLMIALASVAVAAGSWGLLRGSGTTVTDPQLVERAAQIDPDYNGIVIPPNIAPLNFVIRELGARYVVKLYSDHGSAIEIGSRSPAIEIPPTRWRTLLEANRGNELQCDVYALTDGHWQMYQTIVNQIAADPIDSHLVYRLTGPIHTGWGGIQIRQRNLASWDDSLVLNGMDFEQGCVNCHTFTNNRPLPMCVGTRSGPFGSGALVVTEQGVKKVGTKFGYTSWHPSGELAVYSINKVRQFFHTAGNEVRDVIDLDAALGAYKVATDEVALVERASDKDRLETYPSWSPDGGYLYYCSAPILWEDRDALPPPEFAEVRYDLMRISYDLETDTWGEPQTLLAAEDTGLSILQPRVSPDGRYLVFCMCQYGCFPIYQPSSDLYLMDLETSEYRKLDINSSWSESWHSWSSNSRWLAFSSRRRGGVFTRRFISYIDETGHAHKPLVVPQQDPTLYSGLLKSISLPELIIEPVPVDSEAMARAAHSADAIQVDAVSGASIIANTTEPWAPGGR